MDRYTKGIPELDDNYQDLIKNIKLFGIKFTTIMVKEIKDLKGFTSYLKEIGN